jgi:FkbM family methyltransferase
MKRLFDLFVRSTGLGNLPVTARSGMVSGARWTLYPFSSYWRGTSDLDSVRWVDRFCRPGGTALDAGAHFGLYTVGMARRVGPTGQVVSLEPEPAARAKCERHVRMNHLGWVRVFPYAASSSTGTIGLVENGGSGSTTSFVSSEANAGTPLACIRLDDLYAQEKLRLPDFIKIDVENHGAEVLSGAGTVLGNRPNILMSFHSTEELAGSMAILEPRGYRVVSMEGQSVGWDQALYRTAILTTLSPDAFG